jgi:Uma2 family endonuclease
MTSAQVKLPPLMTVADFIEWTGDGTGTRYELVDGVLRAMAPPSDTHGLIQTNLAFAITLHLRATRPGCRINTTPGVQPRLRAEWNFRIPDLGVTCAPNVPGAVMTPDPILLIEILSPGNAADTWDNIPHYASLPSVAEILIVHSTRVRAELLRRDAHGDWPENPTVIDGKGVVRLDSIGLDLPLAEAYASTHLAPA